MYNCAIVRDQELRAICATQAHEHCDPQRAAALTMYTEQMRTTDSPDGFLDGLSEHEAGVWPIKCCGSPGPTQCPPVGRSIWTHFSSCKALKALKVPASEQPYRFRPEQSVASEDTLMHDEHMAKHLPSSPIAPS